MEMTEELYDITIIGAGTTGLFTAFYGGMRDMKTKIIESNPVLGGKVVKFFPEKLIYDIGGIPEILGDDLVKQMEEQAAKHKPTIVTCEWIDDVIKSADGTFVLTSTNGNKHYSKTVIIATGMGTFEVVGPKLENTKLYEESSLHYTISNAKQFTGKRVMIASNNRVGIDWALTLEEIAEKVYLVNRKETFQHAAEEELQQLNNSTVDTRLVTSITQLNGESGFIKEVVIHDKNGDDERIAVDHLLAYDGVKLNPTPFASWGLETDKKRVVVDTNMATAVEGIFVAGDATIYPGKTMLIASGYKEGITAVNSAKKYIEPKASVQVYSTIIYRDKK